MLRQRNLRPALLSARTLAVAILSTFVLCGSAAANRMFVANISPQSISSFTVSPTGVITGVPSSPFATAAQEPRTLITSADSRVLYSGHRTANLISTRSIDGSGALTPFGGNVSTAPASSASVAISPDQRFLYVSTGFNDGDISYFSIAADGSLAPAGAIAHESNGGGITVTPDGRFVHQCTSTGGLHGFSRAADGSLTALAGFPMSIGTSCQESSVTPDGRFLLTGVTGNGLRSYAIAADGSLTQVGPAMPLGPAIMGVETSPDGRSIYVLSGGNGGTSSTISLFKIAPDGTLSNPTISGVVSPPATFSPGMSISSDGRFVAAVISTATSNVAVFDTGNGTGLTPVPGSPFSAGGDTSGGSPKAGITFNNNQGPSVQSIGFSGRNRAKTLNAVGAADADGAVVRFHWSFGDGTTATTTDPTVKHVYAKNGDYAASVTVEDGGGCAATSIFTGRRTLCNASSKASANTTVDATPPSISRQKLRRKSIARNRGKTKLSLRLSESATVLVEFQQKRGRKFVKRASRSLKLKRGTRSATLTAKVGRRKLAKGSYRLRLIATDANNNVSSAKFLTLKIR